MVALTDLQQTLAALNGASFASLDTVTEPTLKGGKANPFKGKLAKHCVGSRVMLFSNKNSSGYENKVRRHLEKAGLNPDSFKLGALPWGKRLPDSPIIENGGKYYLQVVFLEAGKVEYKATAHIKAQCNGFDYTFAPNETVNKNDIQGLSDKTGSEHQGLERSQQVIVRAYALDSIVALRAFGDELK